MSTCMTCSVHQRAICAALPPDDLDALRGFARHRTVAAGQALIWEGDQSLMVANVMEGILKLSTSTGDGREQIVGIVYPSDFIGRPFGGTSQHSVTALTDARVCTFSRSDFDRFARDHPDLGQRLLQRTLTELDRARHWMLLLGRKSADEKMASFLLEMSDRLGVRDCQDPEAGEPAPLFTLPFGRQQIADILGLTIETTSRQLTKMRADGLLDLPSRREIVINDRAAMEMMAG